MLALPPVLLVHTPTERWRPHAHATEQWTHRVTSQVLVHAAVAEPPVSHVSLEF